MPHLNLKKLLDVIKQDPAFIADSETTPSAEKNYGYGIYQTENHHQFIIKQTRTIGKGKDSNMYSPPSYKTMERYRLEVDQNTLQLKLLTNNKEAFFITIDPQTSDVKWFLESGDELSVAKETEIFAKETLAKIAEIQNTESKISAIKNADLKSEKSSAPLAPSFVFRGFGCRGD